MNKPATTWPVSRTDRELIEQTRTTIQESHRLLADAQRAREQIAMIAALLVGVRAADTDISADHLPRSSD